MAATTLHDRGTPMACTSCAVTAPPRLLTMAAVVVCNGSGLVGSGVLRRWGEWVAVGSAAGALRIRRSFGKSWCKQPCYLPPPSPTRPSKPTCQGGPKRPHQLSGETPLKRRDQISCQGIGCGWWLDVLPSLCHSSLLSDCSQTDRWTLLHKPEATTHTTPQSHKTIPTQQPHCTTPIPATPVKLGPSALTMSAVRSAPIARTRSAVRWGPKCSTSACVIGTPNAATSCGCMGAWMVDWWTMAVGGYPQLIREQQPRCTRTNHA